AAALADCDEAIWLDPNLAEAYWHRALLRTGDDAIVDCGRAAELDPYRPEFYRHRAGLREAKKELKQAAGDLQRALELAPFAPPLPPPSPGPPPPAPPHPPAPGEGRGRFPPGAPGPPPPLEGPAMLTPRLPAVLALAMIAAPASAADLARPNVVVILADDLGW